MSALALAFACALPATAGQVNEVRVASGATGTRAEIQLLGKGEFKTISLSTPDRLVVDLPASHAASGLKLPAGAGIVRSVRTGQPDPDTLRIVFDLSGSVVALKPRVEPSASGARLIIEWPGDGPLTPATAKQDTAVPVQDKPVGSPASSANAGVDAARATAALTSQVVRQASTPASVTPTPAVSTSAGTSSPLAILNGQASNHAPPASTTPVKPTVPNTVAVGTAAVPAGQTAGNYTIATGKPPAVAPNAASANATSATGAPNNNVSINGAASTPVAPTRQISSGNRSLIIAIDPGHGGQDSGAVGSGGTYEKNVVLAIARELAQRINATPGMKAYMTRDSDVFIPLPLRARKAREAGADMFVSIHADAAENRNARGSSVYVLSMKGASSQRARWLADKENASDLIGGVPLQRVDNTLSSVLLDLAQSGHMKASEDAANHVLDGLKRVGNNHKPSIERANFAVLRTSDMPAMLVETAFISNIEEERRLKDPAYQRKVAGAVLDGVNTYFLRQPPPGTLFAARAHAEAQARERPGNGSAGSP